MHVSRAITFRYRTAGKRVLDTMPLSKAASALTLAGLVPPRSRNASPPQISHDTDNSAGRAPHHDTPPPRRRPTRRIVRFPKPIQGFACRARPTAMTRKKERSSLRNSPLPGLEFGSPRQHVRCLGLHFLEGGSLLESLHVLSDLIRTAMVGEYSAGGAGGGFRDRGNGRGRERRTQVARQQTRCGYTINSDR